MKQAENKYKKITKMMLSSDGKTRYLVERHRNGKATCTCKGFMYTAVSEQGAHCKHTARASLWK